MNTRWLQNIDIQQIVSSQQYPTENDYLNAFIEFCRLNWDKGIFVYVPNLVNISITRFSVSFALTMHFLFQCCAVLHQTTTKTSITTCLAGIQLNE